MRCIGLEIKRVKKTAKKVKADGRIEARNHIQAAISCLSNYALDNPDNIIAKESIANLGVVYLDLTE